jgi:glycosyltransferase involved in cell wall biosynthesis
VVASELPVLREVGGDAIRYAPVGDAGAWTEAVHGLVESPESSAARSQRITRGRGYSWTNHARTILDAYQRLAAPSRR